MVHLIAAAIVRQSPNITTRLAHSMVFGASETALPLPSPLWASAPHIIGSPVSILTVVRDVRWRSLHQKVRPRSLTYTSLRLAV